MYCILAGKLFFAVYSYEAFFTDSVSGTGVWEVATIFLQKNR